MPEYKAPLRDMRFLIDNVFDFHAHYAALGATDASPDMVSAILEEGAKFCENVLAPLNRSGDEEGCHFDNGVVTTPKGFKQAFAQYVEGGWHGVAADPAYGGQGLPHSLGLVLSEMIGSSNTSWRMYPGLTHGAMSAIHAHGTEVQKATFLNKLSAGEWTGTMCLTEAHCGTDLGLIKTRAVPQADGSYAVSGSKIFISAGEHDLSANIIHLVLAKLPDASAGTKGISLFIVPKFHADSGERNAVHCGSIEHKMGIKASATCVLNFDAAKGFLIGEANKGLNCMLTMKAFNEGNRALTYFTAQLLDIAHLSSDVGQRQEAEDLLAFLTPICKAFMTDTGLEVTNHGMQVFGGHGFIREWGMEQLVRDCRIAPIYEGTNGIQALDLLGRKVLGSQGKLLRGFTRIVHKFCEANAEHAQLKAYVAQLDQLNQQWGELTTKVGMAAMKNPDEVGAAAVDYLMYSGYIILAYLWLRMAIAAQTHDDAEVAKAKLATCDFYFKRLLPRTATHRAAVEAGSECLMSLPAEAFGL